MPSVNKIILIGNLTRDPQTKQLPTQSMVTEFGIAMNRKFKSPDGEDREEVCFVDCAAFGRQAEVIQKYCKKGKKRMARVAKTRIETFPDEDVFEWSYDAIKKRYDASILERQAQQIALATPEQVREVKELLNIVRLPEGLVDKWFNKAQVDTWEDMPAETILKCIEYVKNRLPGNVAAA